MELTAKNLTKGCAIVRFKRGLLKNYAYEILEQCDTLQEAEEALPEAEVLNQSDLVGVDIVYRDPDGDVLDYAGNVIISIN